MLSPSGPDALVQTGSLAAEAIPRLPTEGGTVGP